MSEIDDFLEFLIDGQWHSLKEISKRMDLSESKVKEIANFWHQYGFIELDSQDEMVKILEDARELLTLPEKAEEEAPSKEIKPITMTVNGRIYSIKMEKNGLRIRGDDLNVKFGTIQQQEPTKKTVFMGNSRAKQLLRQTLEIRELLEDEVWHDVEEISESLSIPLDNVITILKIMADYQYVAFAEKWGKVKLRTYRIKALVEASP